jgi:undecaprenyl-diphosphatase
VLAVAVLAGAVLAALVAWLPDRGGFGWDGTVVDLLADAIPISDADVHIEPFVTAVEAVGTALAAALAVWLLVRRRARSVLFLVAAIAGAVLLSSVVKALVQRPSIEGPPDEYTFPSGSATWSMATLAAIVLLLPAWRRVLVPAGAAMILVFCGAIAWEEWHYPSDIVAGWCLALAWVGALFAFLRPTTR